jgi:hypothetical protein
MPTTVPAPPHEPPTSPPAIYDNDDVPSFVADPLVAWIVDRNDRNTRNHDNRNKTTHHRSTLHDSSTSHDSQHNILYRQIEEDSHHQQQQQHDPHDNKDNNDDSFFDVVLVAGFPLWTPTRSDYHDHQNNTKEEDEEEQLSSYEADYQRFLKLVQSCFDVKDEKDPMDTPPGKEQETNESHTDVKDPQQRTQQPSPSPLFLYQSQYLHVTIATMHPLMKKGTNPPSSENMTEPKQQQQQQHYCDIQEYFQSLLRRASQSTLWPTRPFEFVLDRVQLGTHAGILLWKDLTGGIEQIRMALREAEAEELQQQQSSSSSSSLSNNTPTPTQPSFFPIHSIPGIIHSTFLRFHSEPRMCPTRVHERFAQLVLPKLQLSSPSSFSLNTTTSSPQQRTNHKNHLLFSTPIVVSNIHLVCEQTPYMQFEKSSKTVLTTITLSS